MIHQLPGGVILLVVSTSIVREFCHPKSWWFHWENGDLIGYIWVNFITTEACSPEPWNHGLFQGNHPQMAALFSLVKYFYLTRIVGDFLSI